MLESSSGGDSKGLYLTSENGKESRCLVFTSSIKRENGRFHVVVVQRGQIVQNSVMLVQKLLFR